MDDQAEKKKTLLVVGGQAILEIRGEVDDLDESGCVVEMEEKHLKKIANCKEKIFVPGGPEQNVARLAAWIGKSQAMHTTFVGCVGDDQNGYKLSELMKAAGVETRYKFDTRNQTSVAAVLRNQHQVTHYLQFGATQGAEESIPVIQELRPDIIYATLFSALDNEICALHGLLQLAQASTNSSCTRFCLNLAAPFLCHSPEIQKLMPFIDILIGNEVEMLALAKSFALYHSAQKTHLDTIALKLSALPKADGSYPRMIIITRGADRDGTLVAFNSSVQYIPIKVLAPERIHDRNGAGDAMAAGFLTYLLLGHKPSEAIKAGHKAASLVLQNHGCSPFSLASVTSSTSRKKLPSDATANATSFGFFVDGSNLDTFM